MFLVASGKDTYETIFKCLLLFSLEVIFLKLTQVNLSATTRLKSAVNALKERFVCHVPQTMSRIMILYFYVYFHIDFCKNSDIFSLSPCIYFLQICKEKLE